MQGSRITDKQFKYIKENCPTKTPKDIAKHLHLTEPCVRNYLRRFDLPVFRNERKRENA